MADRGRGRGGSFGRGGGRNGRGQWGQRGHQHGQRGGSRGRSHYLRDAGKDSTADRPARYNETPEQQESRQLYRSWRRLLAEAPDSYGMMRRVWEGALRILERGDHDWIQQLPQDLDNEDDSHQGRQHILALLGAKVVGGDFSTFLTNARNFLLTITHHSLVNCLAVDTHVGAIYNLFGGFNGKRAVLFLQRVNEALLGAKSVGRFSLSPEDIEPVLQSMSVALLQLLQRERKIRFNDDLLALVDLFQKTTTTFVHEIGPNLVAHVMIRLDNIRAMIARSQNLIADDRSDDEEDFPNHGKPSSFPREMVVPSDRHDNDKKDFTDITIFPTTGEIASDVKEFLPYTDLDQPHFLADPLQRHLDTYFRLFRHDVFGDLKAGLAGLMHAIAQDPNALSSSKLNLTDIRAYHYPGAWISYMSMNSRKGLQVQIAFPQPAYIRKIRMAKKQEWWDESRRFEEGSVLSFIWTHNAVAQHIFLSVSEKITDSTKQYGLTNHDHLAFITANLITQDRPTFKMLMQASSSLACGALLEFPKIMPATFVPVLENLKTMQRLNRLPFQRWIIPAKSDESTKCQQIQNLPAPLYARAAGFTFPLRILLKENAEAINLDPSASCDDEVLIDELEAKTQLDRGQCRALVAALNREFAFIQGPPGTGKSYLGLQLMRVLLDIKKKARLGPILVVCYTNHALDQFLEHLLEIGVKKIIRVGGQSKSGKLSEHNLRNVRQTESRTKTEGYLAAMNYKTLEANEKEANKAFSHLRALQKRMEWHALKYHIRETHPKIYSQFLEVDDEGFQRVGPSPFEVWRKVIDNHAMQVSEEELQRIIRKATSSVQSLSKQERGVLLTHWVAQAQSDKVGEVFEIIDEATKTQRALNNIHEEANRRVLEEAEVVGVTTSGLAKRISVLQHVKCKVMICEEAGEVMEPHMLSALLPDIEHCIQIGDHEQLRPSVNNYKDLSLESERGRHHQLDRSQFERLLIGNPGRPIMPVAQLNVQRRMRPGISTLIRETIYPKLVDHPSTLDLPDVVGIRKNVFWLDHQHRENQNDMDVQHTKSKSNDWEVEMAHALVRHVVRQGVYSKDQIAVLTPYTGQLQKLRAAMRGSFEIIINDRDQEALERDGFEVNDTNEQKEDSANSQDHRKKPLQKKQISELLRLATVDNFQGEEAKIIIVSLVRSNERNNVGFLKTTNRINVLLSRAQHGMYLIGDTQTYSSVEMWQNVIGMLLSDDAVGESLALCCPRHPDKIIEVKEPEDFLSLSPEGGCKEPCMDRLDCGHHCQARCHSDAMHAVFLCEKPCQRRHPHCDHLCQKPTCGEPCGICRIILNNIQLPCGHVKNVVECYRTLNLTTIPCDVKVTKRVPICRHDVLVKCSEDVSHAKFKCPTACTTVLPCGHNCQGSCSRCRTKGEIGDTSIQHQVCTKTCGRKLGTCNHNCPRLCHDGTDCGLCQQGCEVRCKHTKCPQKCHEPCAPCIEPCVWSCEHQGDCTMPCSAPCNRLPCDERCTKMLPCGHQCPSICGETCAVDYCQQCGMKPDEQPDMVMLTQYADLDIDESPIVVLSCGHFFTMETLDGHVGLKDVYNVDTSTGRFVGLIENAELAACIPQCPQCREPITQYVTQRYNRVINRAVIDEMSKRFIVSGQQELQNLEETLTTCMNDLENSRKALVPLYFTTTSSDLEARERRVKAVNRILSERYRETTVLTHHVKSLQIRMATQHQPSNVLHKATVYAMTLHNSVIDAFANMTLEASAATAGRHQDHRVISGSRLLEIKVRCLVLEDKFEIFRLVKSKAPASALELSFGGGQPIKNTESFLKDCKKLIDDCADENLPKLAVEATLYYARVAQLYGSSGLAKDTDRARATRYRNIAKAQLEKAVQLCEKSFLGRDNLLEAVNHAAKMLQGEWYEAVSKEELEAIKHAMVTGPRGIASHSGHWYNCVNGHPFAIGECGMPMQLARCPECGAPVGGQGHQAVAGVSRATQMEN